MKGDTIISHIDPNLLERFAAQPGDLEVETRRNIEQHLEACAFCREHLKHISDFQVAFEERLKGSPTSEDADQASRILRTPETRSLPVHSPEGLIESYAELLALKDAPTWKRLVGSMRTHPVKTAGAAAGLAAALVLIVLAFRSSVDTNPSYAMVQDQTIQVYNRQNEILWTKNVEGFRNFPEFHRQEQKETYGPFGATYYLKGDASGPLPVRVFDLDGDNKNEVLVSGGAYQYSTAFSADSLYCFDSDGILRWSYAADRRGLKFGTTDFTAPSNWQIERFIRIQRTPEERIQLFVVSHHRPSWPSRIAEVDPVTGKEIQTYWHTGGISVSVVNDIEGDGTQELIFAGINNAFNRVCVLVFNPRRVEGVGPTLQDWMPAGSTMGSQTHYILLPRTDLIPSDVPYNLVNTIQAPEAGGLLLHTHEGTRLRWQSQEAFGGIVYTFDGTMEIANVIASSILEKDLTLAKNEGLIAGVELNETFYHRLRNAIEYWDSEQSRFVRYEDFKKKKPIP